MLDWLKGNGEIVAWLSGLSVLFFIASLVVVGVVIVKLPADYFQPKKRRPLERKGGLALRIANNVLGVVVLIAGIAMLVLPGQGLLAILIGVMLLNFPGKYRVERWIMTRGKVLRTANWLRRKFDAAPLQLDQPGEE